MSILAKILIITISSLIGLFLIFFISNGIIFTRISFSRRKGDKDFAKNEDPRAKKDPDRIWYFSNEIEEINLKSYDKKNLKGYFLNNHSNKLVIMVHGYHGRYYSLTSQAHIFFDNGFDVLSINNRCHDSSEGKLITMGKRESRDLEDWIELMIKRNPNYQIALYGISMGGHIVMLTGSKPNVNEKVKCIIEDCGFNSLKNELILMVKQSPAPFPRLTVNLAELYSIIFHHFSYSNSIDKAFKTLKLPILLIHGSQDNYVPTENIYLNEKAVPKDVYYETHVFEGSGHTKSVVDSRKKYTKIVDDFVNKFIK